MKWGRFLLAMASGAVIGYLLVNRESALRPETVIQSLKSRYQHRLSILGSWIDIEPRLEEVNGFNYRVYRCGLTGLEDGEPSHLEFKVDAETGEVLSVQS